MANTKKKSGFLVVDEACKDIISETVYIFIYSLPVYTYLLLPQHNCTGLLGVKHQLTLLRIYFF